VEAAEHLLAQAGSRRRGRRVLDGEDPAIAARIRDLVETHHTTAGIARELGVSVDSVRTVLRHLGMPTDNRYHAARTRTQER
jgi:DNA invertase Pin-like site-specific DNA recombinase